LIWFKDLFNRQIRLTDERLYHIETDHPEMTNQIVNIKETLKDPDIIVRSKIDSQVELFYKLFKNTPVTEKYLCIVIKSLDNDIFIITAYFTDTVKRGDILWQRK